MSKETIDRANEIVETYSGKQLNKALESALRVFDGEKPENEEDLDIILKTANDWVNFIAGVSDELYNEFCMRKFVTTDGETFLARGEEDMTIHTRNE